MVSASHSQIAHIVCGLLYRGAFWGMIYNITCCSEIFIKCALSVEHHYRECKDFFKAFIVSNPCDKLELCHTCSLCRVELVVQFPARGSTQVLICLFPGVLWLWHFLYSVGPHPVSSLHIYSFIKSRAFMAGAASQAGDADSSRAPGLTSGLQRSVNVHRGALLLVPQWQCISSFVFYFSFALFLEKLEMNIILTSAFRWRILR